MESRKNLLTKSGEGQDLSPRDWKAVSDTSDFMALTEGISSVNYPLYNLIPDIIDPDNLLSSFNRVLSNLREASTSVEKRDDNLVLIEGKKYTRRQARYVIHKSSKLGLTIKENERVAPITAGMDALGYINFGEYARLRRRTVQKASRKLSEVKSRKRGQELIGSFKGMACHADCKYIFHLITGKRMKKFSELGVVYAPADGKKRFPGKVMRLSAIQNKVLEIHDYGTGMTTSQGDDRYLVSFRDTHTNEWGKFFTASEEMKNILDQVSDIEDGFPFETTIVSEIFDGNKQKFSFS